MSIKATTDMVEKKLKEQGKDLNTELARIMADGRIQTHAAAINQLAADIAIERETVNISGYYLKKMKDRFGRMKTYIYSKNSGVLAVSNVEKDFESFTPVVFEKISLCHNILKNTRWLEATSDTIINSNGEPNVQKVLEEAKCSDDIIERDYYLTSGVVKFVNAAPIYEKDRAPGDKPKKTKPLVEVIDGEEVLNLKITITDQYNKNINLTITKMSQLIHAYPEKPKDSFVSWFESAKDDQRLYEIQKGLANSTLLVMGQGSRYIEKKNQPKEVLKKPFLTIGEDGLVFNLERYGIDGLPMPDPSAVKSSIQPSKPSGLDVFSDPASTAQKTVGYGKIPDAVLKWIKDGKGTKQNLMVELPKALGVSDTNEIIQAIKLLGDKGEIYRQGTGDSSMFKATDALP